MALLILLLSLKYEEINLLPCTGIQPPRVQLHPFFPSLSPHHTLKAQKYRRAYSSWNITHSVPVFVLILAAQKTFLSHVLYCQSVLSVCLHSISCSHLFSTYYLLYFLLRALFHLCLLITLFYNI